jgi:hypothetical protein
MCHIVPRGDRVERARLYKAANERCFGVQIATKTIAEGVAAAKLAQEAGGGATYLPSLQGLGRVQRRQCMAVRNTYTAILFFNHCH